MPGLLGNIFSTIDTQKRKLTDLLGNPVESIQQIVGNVNDRARNLNELTAAAAQEKDLYGPKSQQLASLLAEAYNPIGLTVYHGSPAKFTKFDPTKIGSGEGAQAYGYGHYVAEAPGVAKEYQEVLASPRNQAMAKRGVYIEPSPAGDNTWRVAKPSEIGKSRGQTGDATQGITDYRFNSPASAIKYAKRQGLLSAEEKPILTEIASEGAYRPVRSAAEMEDRAYNQLIASEPGYFYEIDLPDEQIAKMLDWDKPFNEQPKNVQEFFANHPAVIERLSQINAERTKLNEMYPGRLTNPKLKDIVGKETTVDSLKGSKLYEILTSGASIGKDEAARVDAMRQAGVPGIRYLDQGSRSNFMVQNTVKGKPYGEPVSFMTEKQAQDYAAEQIEKGFGTKIIPGTSNFVVFPGNEGLLTILKRNGGLLGQ